MLHVLDDTSLKTKLMLPESLFDATWESSIHVFKTMDVFPHATPCRYMDILLLLKDSIYLHAQKVCPGGKSGFEFLLLE